MKNEYLHLDKRVGWLCFTSHRQRSHLETAFPFTVPCEGREARYLYSSHRELNPRPSRGSPLHYRCAMPYKFKYKLPTLLSVHKQNLANTQTSYCGISFD